MVRTSLYLPEEIVEALSFKAKREKKSMSRIAANIFKQSLQSEEDQQREAMYKALDELKGKFKSKIGRDSLEIDEILYGENGAWRGSGNSSR